MIDLKTAKVIVTGGSEGVGLEMARALVQRVRKSR
jgi:NAD(P)-dependent dehydrogenase (short-subunit alcohol dehydrogenase family)